MAVTHEDAFEAFLCDLGAVVDGDGRNIVEVVDELLPARLVQVKFFSDIVLGGGVGALPDDKAGGVAESLEEEEDGKDGTQRDEEAVGQAAEEIFYHGRRGNSLIAGMAFWKSA